MQLAVEQTKLAGRQQAVREREQTLREALAPVQAKYQTALARQAELNPALQLLDMLLSGQATPSSLRFSTYADDKYLYGYAFDPTTGAVRLVLKQPIQKDKSAAGAGSKTPASKYKIIDDLLAQTFLPIYEAGLRYKYPDEKTVSERLAVLRDQFGNINSQRLYASLPPQIKKLWARLYKLYEQQVVQGANIGDLFEKTGVVEFYDDINKASTGMAVGRMAITPGGLLFRVNQTGDPKKDFRYLLWEDLYGKRKK